MQVKRKHRLASAFASAPGPQPDDLPLPDTFSVKVVELTTDPKDPDIIHKEEFTEQVEVNTLSHEAQLPGSPTEHSSPAHLAINTCPTL